MQAGYLGESVNVVVIDEGLDKGAIPPQNWGGGLDHYIDTDLVLPAGGAPPTSHGMMIARSILNLAPQARLYDVPVIPQPPRRAFPCSSVQSMPHIRACWPKSSSASRCRSGRAHGC